MKLSIKRLLARQKKNKVEFANLFQSLCRGILGKRIFAVDFYFNHYYKGILGNGKSVLSTTWAEELEGAGGVVSGVIAAFVAVLTG